MLLREKKEKIDYKIMLHFLPHKYSYTKKIKGEMMLENLKEKDVLDVGVGCGWFSRFAKDRGYHVMGVDIADKVIKENRWFGKATGEKIKIKKASVYNLPFDRSAFDSVVLSEVLEHLAEPEKGLTEINRVLRKRGRLLVILPGYSYRFVYDKIFNFLSNSKYLGYDRKMSSLFAEHGLLHSRQEQDLHRFEYTIGSVEKMLKNSGFEVKDVANVEFLSPFVNTVLCNFLGFKRQKIAFMEKLDTFLMGKVPLFLGSDWMFVCQKERNA